MNPTLILIGGPAGAGKTFVAHAVARVLPSTVLLDKDTLTSPLVEALLLQLGQPPTDRDSTVYQEQVRPLEYATLMAAAFETLQTGRVVLAVAPFARELHDPHWLATTCARAKQLHAGFGVVWVQTTAPATHARIRARGEARDALKLRQWPEYVARTSFAAPQVQPLHVFHNDGSSGDGSNGDSVDRPMAARASGAQAGRFARELQSVLDFIAQRAQQRSD